MLFKSMNDLPFREMLSATGRQFALLLTGILALLLAGCGGSDGGNNGIASCTLTAEELDNLTPEEVDSLPKACRGLGFFDTPSITGLYILGTEIDGLELKLYVHGIKPNGTPMTLADFQQASVTLDGIDADPAATVALAPPGVLSMGLLADYSLSITENDLTGMGDLYDVILNKAPADFEAEVINFSDQGGVPAITVKPGASHPHWTENLFALQAATDVDDAQARENTTLYDAMGTGLMGPLADAFNPFADDFGLVERGRPATLMVVHTDGRDTASLTLGLDDITSLLERCHTTVIMLGTLRSEVDALILEELAGTRGAAVNALNTNFFEEAINAYADSLGNLVVFTLSPDTLFAGKTVEIEVDGETASAVEPFNIGAGCQI